MPGIVLKSPFGRMFNASGSAGPRRLLIIGGIAFVSLAAVGLVTLERGSSVPPPTLAKAPKVDPLPGGPHVTPAYTDLAIRNDKEKAAKAAALGQSSVAAMPGSASAVLVNKPPAQASSPEPTALSNPPPAVETGASAPPILRRPAPSPPFATPVALQQQHPDDNQTKAYQAAITSLLGGWGSKPQMTEVILQPEDSQHASGRGGDRNRADPAASVQDGSDAGPTSDPRRPGDRSSGRVLMPAGRGVYGKTLLASSSDQGGPVVIEALSGPVVGDRMAGGFELRDDRLVVHLNSITLQDGTQQKIDALVIAPDSMETSVASSVDQHYFSRFVLPVAAAFVSGLGQAISQSNSTVVAGPLGGATAFQQLNLSQELGVAAGAGAAQFGQAVLQAAPKGPTVKLDANVNVGVLFLSPLVVGEH